MEFTHVIITRFNIFMHGTKEFPRNDADWLNFRFDLFQKFCFPSISSQTNRNFKWFLLFDSETPSLFMKLLRAYNKLENVEIILCKKDEDYIAKVIEHIKNMPKKKWIVTTRLDNDDAVSCYFVEWVQSVVSQTKEARFLKNKQTYINFMCGLQYHDGKIYVFEDKTNPFVSLVELTDDIKTTFWKGHPAIYEAPDVLQIKTNPLWLQTVHGTNVYNHLRGELSHDSNLLGDFVLNLG